MSQLRKMRFALSTSAGQVAVQTLLPIAGLLSAVAVPIIWGGQVDAANKVQDVKIANLEQQQQVTATELRVIRIEVETLLIRQGIDPNKLTLKGQ